MSVTSALHDHLENFFEDQDTKDQKGQGGQSIVDFYETVQHCGSFDVPSVPKDVHTSHVTLFRQYRSSSLFAHHCRCGLH
jgi:hypothetical protein